MIPKEKLSLLNNVDNVFNYPQSTIDAQSIDRYEKNDLLQIVRMTASKINHFSSDFMLKRIDAGFPNVDFVRFKKYPLPGVYNKKTNNAIVNLDITGKKEVTNVDGRELYAIIIYAYLCKLYSIKPVDLREWENIANFMSETMVKVFGKKYGIIADYVEALPKLRFITISYVLTSYFGQDQKKTYLRAARSGASVKDFPHSNIDSYDLRNIRDYLRLLSDATVFPGISVSEFAKSIINRYGIVMLPFFEDQMRFMATLGAGNIGAGDIFPLHLETSNKTIYDKILGLIKIGLR